ncbi:hypothetical protein JNW87_26500, partial [Micromonospora sp. ATA51]|nr:hypothetical protein [Micromonospora sp. ATA51]
MPAERDQHSVVGSSQPTGLWPGQDIPRQQGDRALPWPDSGGPARPHDARSALPWPGAGEPAGHPVATDVRPERAWPDTDHPDEAGPEPRWADPGYPPVETAATPRGRATPGPSRRWRAVRISGRPVRRRPPPRPASPAVAGGW